MFLRCDFTGKFSEIPVFPQNYKYLRSDTSHSSPDVIDPDDTTITEVNPPEPELSTTKHTQNKHQMSSRFPPLTREKGTDIFSFRRPPTEASPDNHPEDRRQSPEDRRQSPEDRSFPACTLPKKNRPHLPGETQQFVLRTPVVVLSHSPVIYLRNFLIQKKRRSTKKQGTTPAPPPHP